MVANVNRDAAMIDDVVDWVVASSRVVALTGAGVSTASGIPDFRGPQGVWTRDPSAERLSSIDVWIADPDVRRQVWRRRLEARTTTYAPNDAHHALVLLEEVGRLETLVTQNIDGLHRDAGTSIERLVEIHGTERDVRCLDCGARAPMATALDRVAAGDDDPHCLVCDGLLKAATISFGQDLEPDDVERAYQAAISSEVMITAGTSLGVFPAAHLPQAAKHTGARLVIINAQPTPFDEIADAVVHDDAGASLMAIADRVRHRLGL